MAALNLTDEQLSNLLKSYNAVNSLEKLPSFRGRARESDYMFEESTSFRTHIGTSRTRVQPSK